MRRDGIAPLRMRTQRLWGTRFDTPREVVRLRPTWHFALGEDIRWLLKATAPRVNALNAYYNRQHKLDAKLFAKSNSIIGKALEGGAHLTRSELAAVLRRGGIRATGNRLVRRYFTSRGPATLNDFAR